MIKTAFRQKYYLTEVLFTLLKGYARLAIKIYCRKIVINQPAWLLAKGPILLACNHPNSFLDGIILTTLFNENVYSLARGDAFRKPWHGAVLRKINLLPVYRTSEGVENLEYNYTTFEACKDVFRKNGIVIIFSEGGCVNEWHLRPLRKGTARLATSAWNEGINLTVLPIGFNYSRFRNFGKNVVINFGQPLDRKGIMIPETEGKRFLRFNTALQAALQKLVFEISPDDDKTLDNLLSFPLPQWKRVVLFLPGVLGIITHLPLYLPAKALTRKYFDNDHFDSTLVSMLVLAYPVYLILFVLLVGVLVSCEFALVVTAGLPFFAWSAVQLKPQQ